MKKGRLITLEGMDGSGKSSQVQSVTSWLEAKGIPFVVTREPGGTPKAEDIRHLIVSTSFSPMTQLLLCLAARREHMTDCILPALREGRWVVCDRFIDSTYVYQGCAQGLGGEVVQRLQQEVCEPLVPDLTCVFDLPVFQARTRVGGRPTGPTVFDQYDEAFHEKVRQGFLDLASTHHRFVLIDASCPLEEVTEAVCGALERRFF